MEFSSIDAFRNFFKSHMMNNVQFSFSSLDDEDWINVWLVTECNYALKYRENIHVKFCILTEDDKSLFIATNPIIKHTLNK